MDYKREININDVLYQEGDVVDLPLSEKGIIQSIDRKALWGFRYEVKITEGTFNEVGDVVRYKSEQFVR